MLRSQPTRASAVPGSAVIQVVSPSSTTCRACSTWPLGLRISASVEVRGARPVSAWVVIECSQDSRSGPVDGDHGAVREVDHGQALVEQALLAGRVAVVPGDAGVRTLRRHRAGAVQQRVVDGLDAHSTRFSCADACDCIGWPTAAMSMTHIRSPSTRPYIRVAAVYSLAVGVRATRSVSQGDPGAVRLADVDLHVAGRVGQQHLEVAALADPPEAGLAGQRAHLGALVVQQPGLAAVVQEGPAVVPELDLLAEVGRLDRRVPDHAGALPAADQPGQRDERGGQVGVQLHGGQLCPR